MAASIPPMTFGQRLKQQREVRGIGLEAVAAATKIGRRHLDALERDDFDSLPGDVFAKGFVRAVAEFIGADPDALVEDYMRERGSRTPAAADDSDVAVLREMSRVLKSGSRADAARTGTARRSVGVVVVVAAGAIALATLIWIGAGLLRGEGVGSVTPVTVMQQRVTPKEEEAAAVVPDDAVEEVTPPPLPPPPPPVVEKEEPEPVEPEPEPEPEAAPAPAPRTDLVYEPPPPPTRLLVSEYGVGTDIVNHRLVGQADSFREGSDVWFWTHVLRAEPGGKIRHVWIHEGSEVTSVELELGSGNWRTQSRKKLPFGAVGGWSVEARDIAGRVLARQAFVCISSGNP